MNQHKRKVKTLKRKNAKKTIKRRNYRKKTQRGGAPLVRPDANITKESWRRKGFRKLRRARHFVPVLDTLKIIPFAKHAINKASKDLDDRFDAGTCKMVLAEMSDNIDAMDEINLNYNYTVEDALAGFGTDVQAAIEKVKQRLTDKKEEFNGLISAISINPDESRKDKCSGVKIKRNKLRKDIVDVGGEHLNRETWMNHYNTLIDAAISRNASYNEVVTTALEADGVGNRLKEAVAAVVGEAGLIADAAGVITYMAELNIDNDMEPLKLASAEIRALAAATENMAFGDTGALTRIIR